MNHTSNITKEVPLENLQEEIDYEEVCSAITDHGRWSIHEEVIVKDRDGNFWQYMHEKPATEMQEVYQDDPVTLTAVMLRPVTTYEWVPVKIKVKG